MGKTLSYFANEVANCMLSVDNEHLVWRVQIIFLRLFQVFIHIMIDYTSQLKKQEAEMKKP